jgi:hypothetical protein
MDVVEIQVLLLRMTLNQGTSVETWYDIFNKHPDLSGFRNAIEAMARWYGMYKACMALYGPGNMPQEVQDQFNKFYHYREAVLEWTCPYPTASANS